MREKKTRTISLVLTNNCNLNCVYCYEKNKFDEVMPVELGKKILQNELIKNDNSNYESIVLDFFGGEPFLEFETMKALVEYAYDLPIKNTLTCFTTTNGTLIHGEIQDWLLSNKSKITCGLSLDGTRHMHNTNRNLSYDSIDLNFFKSTWPNQSVKMTISPDTIHCMSDGVIDLHERGFMVDCNLANGIEWDPTFEQALVHNLERLIQYYLDHPNIIPCSMLNVPLDIISGHSKKRGRLCGAGKHMCIYDTDGQKFPCQYFLPLSQAHDGLVDLGPLEFEDDLRYYLPNKCKDCTIYSVCPNCYGDNLLSRKNIFENSVTNCIVAKHTTLASAVLKWRKIQAGLVKFHSAAEEYRVLRGINIALQLTEV